MTLAQLYGITTTPVGHAGGTAFLFQITCSATVILLSREHVPPAISAYMDSQRPSQSNRSSTGQTGDISKGGYFTDVIPAKERHPAHNGCLGLERIFMAITGPDVKPGNDGGFPTSPSQCLITLSL